MPITSLWLKRLGLGVLVGLPVCVSMVVISAKVRLKQDAVAEVLTGGDLSLAPPIFRRYGCVGCHSIPGISGADGKVGGQLVGLSDQVYIGGVANNTADNLVAWIVSPQQFSSRSAMPATGITETEARHLAAYLYAR